MKQLAEFVHLTDLMATAEKIRAAGDHGCYGPEFTEALALFMETAVDHEPWLLNGPHEYFCRCCGFSDSVCQTWQHASTMVQAYKEREKSGDAAPPDHRD